MIINFPCWSGQTVSGRINPSSLPAPTDQTANDLCWHEASTTVTEQTLELRSPAGRVQLQWTWWTQQWIFIFLITAFGEWITVKSKRWHVCKPAETNRGKELRPDSVTLCHVLCIYRGWKHVYELVPADVRFTSGTMKRSFRKSENPTTLLLLLATHQFLV